jgi:hypothetical protein
MSKAKTPTTTTRRKKLDATSSDAAATAPTDPIDSTPRPIHTGQCRILRTTRIVCVLPCGGYGWVTLYKDAVYPFDQIKVKTKGSGEENEGGEKAGGGKGGKLVDGYMVRVLGGGWVSLGGRWFGEMCEEV